MNITVLVSIPKIMSELRLFSQYRVEHETYVQQPNRNNQISNDKNHGDFPVLHLHSLAHLERQLLQFRNLQPCWKHQLKVKPWMDILRILPS